MKLRLVPGRPNPSSITVQAHQREHLSDILARYLILEYGQQKYGAGAPVRGERVVLVGRGGYDEHTEPQLHECEATLVANDLGVRELPELQPILDYTLKVDRFGQGKGVLKFGRVVELMHDAYPSEPQRVEQWATVLIAASIEARRESVDAATPDIIVFPLIRRACRKVESEFTSKVWEKLNEALTTFTVAAEVQPFGLTLCAGLLWWKFRRLPEPEREAAVVAWIADALRAELVNQREFLAAAGDYEKGEEFSMTISGEEIIGIVVPSDNRRIHSYLFNEIDWIAVAVVRRSSGNVQIFRKPRAKVKLELWSVAAQIRALEQQRAGEPVSTWEQLVSQHGPEGAAQRWFLHYATQNLFNGALTAARQATAFTNEEIKGCIIRGLDDAYLAFRRQFYLERGGPVGQ